MNNKFALHYRIFTRFPFHHKEAAERLCNLFVQHGDDLTPTHYSPTEPIRTEFDSQDMSVPATLLSETSHHLLLRRSKPQWMAYIYWLRGRVRPWFWTFDFSAEWINSNRLIKSTKLIVALCNDFDVLFASGGISGDWHDKHTIIDQKKGKNKDLKGSSFNPGTGLPGIYWFNFLGKELVDFFGQEKLLQLRSNVAEYQEAQTVNFLTYDAPDQQDREWRRSRERKVVEILGEEYFFDLEKAAGKRPRRRTPIPGVTDAKSLKK